MPIPKIDWKLFRHISLVRLLFRDEVLHEPSIVEEGSEYL
jgi:hypothetical protein